MSEKIASLVRYFSENKTRRIFLLIASVGIVLLIAFSGGGESDDVYDDSLSEYKRTLEKELEVLCSSIDGAGKCDVSVSFLYGEKYEYKGSSKIGSEPPRVLGVAVVSEGAESAEVRRAICESLCALFDIGSNRVSVQKMK